MDLRARLAVHGTCRSVPCTGRHVPCTAFRAEVGVGSTRIAALRASAARPRQTLLPRHQQHSPRSAHPHEHRRPEHEVPERRHRAVAIRLFPHRQVAHHAEQHLHAGPREQPAHEAIEPRRVPQAPCTREQQVPHESACDPDPERREISRSHDDPVASVERIGAVAHKGIDSLDHRDPQQRAAERTEQRGHDHARDNRPPLRLDPRRPHERREEGDLRPRPRGHDCERDPDICARHRVGGHEPREEASIHPEKPTLLEHHRRKRDRR